MQSKKKLCITGVISGKNINLCERLKGGSEFDK
jgi:hypothetical protein